MITEYGRVIIAPITTKILFGERKVGRPHARISTASGYDRQIARTRSVSG